jgi:hypothetical protein
MSITNNGTGPTKHSLRNPQWDKDIKRLDSLANAYHNAECGTTKATWKKKWYELCGVIADRMRLEQGRVRKH